MDNDNLKIMFCFHAFMPKAKHFPAGLAIMALSIRQNSRAKPPRQGWYAVPLTYGESKTQSPIPAEIVCSLYLIFEAIRILLFLAAFVTNSVFTSDIIQNVSKNITDIRCLCTDFI